ncbi:MAG: GxxExxY protein [Bacteroidetes bacterium]|nr:GxxExxY protein [Bacteroidota bacterium]
MLQNEKNKEVVFPELSYKIVGCAYEVQNELGGGFPEKYYQKALAIELRTKLIEFREQVYFPLEFKSEQIGKNYFDFLIEDNIVVEIKRGNHFSKSHFDQILRYLKVSDKRLGLLINFATEEVQVKRILNLY